jgi:hypothetical protein
MMKAAMVATSPVYAVARPGAPWSRRLNTFAAIRFRPRLVTWLPGRAGE